MLVGAVRVAARGVRLPDLDQGLRNRLAVLVEHAAGDDDAFADRLALVLAGEVMIALLHVAVAEKRTGQLGERLRRHDERLGRMALARGRVGGIVVVGLSTGMRSAVAAQFAHRASPSSVSGAAVMR